MQSAAAPSTVTGHGRRAGHLVAALVVVVLAASVPATAAGRSEPVSGAAASRAPAAAPSRTTLTFKVDNCRHCWIQLIQGADEPPYVLWFSANKKVRHGTVSYTTRNKHTHGLQAVVHAPWEGHTMYATNVAFRYGRTDPGDRMTFRTARHKHRAAPCWAGTHRDAVTFLLVVRRVTVSGVHERVPGSIAFTQHSRRWLAPMVHVRRGVLGSQDAFACH